ncbi:helix-turn-helix domain-containing protein [Actinomycetota bacterium Odt1-20B]
MNPPTQPTEPGRPGRKLGPISENAGPTHRAWLEQLRQAYQASGLTLQQLENTTGWSRSKISELLRAAGRYPRWEFIRDLLNALGWPLASVEMLRRMWVQAAREANKRTVWINDCVLKDLRPGQPPLDFSAFQHLHRPVYHAYTSTFLRRPADARRAVDDVFNLLLILWDEALESENPERFAWQLLRGTVLERTPQADGHPALAEAAFDTLALHRTEGVEARFRQIEESLSLFEQLRRLPEAQLDVMVLLHLRGQSETATADVLGLSLASVRSTARHARRNLFSRLYPDRTAQEGHPGDLDH